MYVLYMIVLYIHACTVPSVLQMKLFILERPVVHRV